MLAVLTHDDWQADGLGVIASLAPQLLPLKRPDGAPIHEPYRPPLAAGAVKFVGDPVAFVVAGTAAQARDAAELVKVDYEELPAVIDTPDALEPGAPLVWPDLGDNVSFRQTMGDLEAVDAIFKSAPHVVTADLPIGRLAQNPMEPRAAIGEYDPVADRYTLWTGTQGPHDNRNLLARDALRVPIGKLRLVSPDMGGGFGLRGGLFPEMALVVWAAKRAGRPVKWSGDRSEHFLVDDHGRDSRPVAELALNEDGDFPRGAGEIRRRAGRLLQFLRPAADLRQHGRHRRHVPDRRGLGRRHRRVHQHLPDRPLSRRRAAGIHLYLRDAGREGGGGAGLRPGRAAGGAT